MKKFYLLGCVMLSFFCLHAQTLQWAKKIGGPGPVGVSGLAIDGAGNVYTTGYLYGTADLDPGPATFNLTSAGSEDIFISKLDAAGNFVWAKRIGGTAYDIATSIAVDGAGNIYVTGEFRGTVDFDPGPGTVNVTPVSTFYDGFVIKLDAAANLSWVRQLGGVAGAAEGQSIVTDGSGNIYVGGNFSGTVDFDGGTGVFNLTTAKELGYDLGEVFVSKLNTAGDHLWTRQMGGATRSYDDESLAITTDGSSNVYITSYYEGSRDFDPGAATFTLTSVDAQDIFISKLDAAGNFNWAKSIGGEHDDEGQSIAVDGAGNVYTTGYFEEGPVDFDPGPGTYNLTVVYDRDAYVNKLDASGNFVWAKRLGGGSSEEGYSMAIDGTGNLYIGGLFQKTVDFDPGPGTFNLTGRGVDELDDMFLCKLDAAGNFVWAMQMGGAEDDYFISLAVDNTGNIYTAGVFQGTANFAPSPGTVNLTAGSNQDTFVGKYSQGSGPSVTINQAAAQADPTTASPVNFTVVFSQVVTGFSTGDVSISGTAGASTATVTGSGTTYNVAVSGMTTSGTVIVSIPTGVAVNAGGTGNLASTSIDNTVTFTIVVPAPTVTINQSSAQADPTTTSPVNFTVVFDQTVTGFATGDVTVSGTAGATTATVTGSGTTYNVAVSGMTTSGTVIVNILAGVAVNAGGTGNLAATSTDNTVTFTITAPPPTVTIDQAAAQADPTTTSPINFTVVFNQPVTGFTTGDVTLSGTAGASTATVTGSGSTYNVAVSGMTTSGTVIVNIPAGVAVNAGSTGNLASTSTDNAVTFTVVVPAPTVTINQAAAQADPTTTSPINFTVVFNQTVTGFITGGVTLSGTAGATTATITGSGTTYNVAVSGMTTSGTVIVNIPAGVAVNAGGTGNLASTSTDNTVTFTSAAPAPTVIINQAAAQADPATTSPVNFTVVFNQTVTGFATGDVTISGTAGATVATITGSGTTYNVAVSGMTTSGTIIVNIPVGIAVNAGGTGNLASTSTDNTVTFTAPICSIICPQNITVNNTTNQCGAIVNYPAPTTTGACGIITTSPASGSYFPVGNTTVTATNSAGFSCSFVVTVVNNQQLSITTQPTNKLACEGSSASFSVTATNAISYQWQVNSGSGFTNISGATQSTLTLDNTTGTMNGNQYRVLVNGVCTNLTSGSGVLTVNLLPTITFNLTNDSIYRNSPVQKLAGGLPLGGDYTGTSVVNGIINPAALQQGDYTIKYTYVNLNGCVNSATDRITILPSANKVNIFPNPARDGNTNILVFPDMIGATVKVYDEQGRKVGQWLVPGRLRTYQFKWGAGMYLFEFRKGTVREVKKIIIVR